MEISDELVSVWSRGRSLKKTFGILKEQSRKTTYYLCDLRQFI